jgi:hypothetical protein
MKMSKYTLISRHPAKIAYVSDLGGWFTAVVDNRVEEIPMSDVSEPDLHLVETGAVFTRVSAYRTDAGRKDRVSWIELENSELSWPEV